MTSTYELYFSPGACSRVAMVALEWVGADYALHPILLANGDHRQSAFQALNPKGQVPVLTTPDGALTETVAIALYLQQQFPDARLLPADGAYESAAAISWLVWCSSTLHPLIFRARMAGRIHPDVSVHEGIRDVAVEGLCRQLALAEHRLSEGRLWLGGDACSLVDMYLLWCFERAIQAGCDMAVWPALADWQARAQTHPAWVRMLQREAQAVSAMEVSV